MKTQSKTRLDHIISFLLSIVINGVLMVAMLYFISGGDLATVETVTVQVLDMDDVTPIDDVPDDIIEDPVEVDDSLPDVEFAIFESDVTPDFTPDTEVVQTPTDTNVNELTQLMSDIVSPVQMNIAPGRTALGRQAALNRYGQGLGGQTEPAVNRALDWLARVQKQDGSWDKDGNPSGRGGNAGYTGLALLTFLSAGKTPGDREYGQTVARAIRYLVEVQEQNGAIRGGGREVYAHPMATYALAEAYTMTDNMILREPLIRATRLIIESQMADGGFPGPGNAPTYVYGGGGNNDSSVTAWHVQALKAVAIAAEQHGLEIPGLQQALQKSMDGMLVHAQTHEQGLTIGYTSPGRRNIITAAGALGMHLTGRHRQRQTSQMMNYLNALHNPPEWGNNTIGNEYGGMINFYYYAVQAFFHSNPDSREFRTFYTGMARALAGNQSPEGYWLCFHDRGRGQGRVYNTTLGALSLMVTYRYLPTTQAERIQTQPTSPSQPGGDADDDLIQFEI